MKKHAMTDEELDAMSAEQAWERCCYAAWILRKQALQHEAMRAGYQRFMDDVAEELLRKMPKP